MVCADKIDARLFDRPEFRPLMHQHHCRPYRQGVALGPQTLLKSPGHVANLSTPWPSCSVAGILSAQHPASSIDLLLTPPVTVHLKAHVRGFDLDRPYTSWSDQ